MMHDNCRAQEECACWDINDVVFKSEGLWGMFQPLLRADFHVFDSYRFDHASAPPFEGLPIHTFWVGADDDELCPSWGVQALGSFAFRCSWAPQAQSNLQVPQLWSPPPPGWQLPCARNARAELHEHLKATLTFT